ncbi:MAG: twin-arginine translocation signal domain-containing protein [Chloroflexi bacterium]|nr:twin-arginine translocation signal domain-containing protein [Chloroflexota bacterium]
MSDSRGPSDQPPNRAQAAPRRRVRRRRLLKVAAATGAAVASASNVYVRPSVRLLKISEANAFSF